jgi:hypothetical protein
MINSIEVANTIQLSVAPAFLLTGAGAILAVMANRLSRIVDRFRILNESDIKIEGKDSELNFLLLRARWTHWAIALTTTSALLLCVVIAAIFISTEISFSLHRFMDFFFSAAMISLIVGLLCFLREVQLSKNVIRLNKK